MTLALTLFLVAGCGSPTGPDSGDTVEIMLAVSGGIAGIDWQLTVNGAEGRIVGDRCAGQPGCDWTAGDILATFDATDLIGLATEFTRRGFFDGPADFGTECCDQFDYVLSYRDDDEDRTVTGSDARIPQNIRDLILLVEQFVSDARLAAPALEGQIVGIGSAIPFGGERTIWVKAMPESPCGVVYTVDSGTDIRARQADGSIQSGVFDDLLMGQPVRVWSGPIAESCPGQADADAIEITSPAATG